MTNHFSFSIVLPRTDMECLVLIAFRVAYEQRGNSREDRYPRVGSDWSKTGIFRKLKLMERDVC